MSWRPSTVPDDFRSGFVAVVGRPNVGKSTLVNALVGEKVSIVTSKPQTTRHRVLGVLNRDHCQTVLVDTPGLTPRSPSMMHRAMNRAATGSAQDADLSLMVVASPRDRLLPFIDQCYQRFEFTEVIPVSATRQLNLDRLTEVLEKHLPAGPPLFPADQITDRGMSFKVGETVREKLMHVLRQELPYGIAVEVQQLDQGEDLLRCEAIIWVARNAHKAMVIGRGGKLIKQIGTQARLDLEQQTGQKVHLETHVKVRANWLDDDAMLRSLGFEA